MALTRPRASQINTVITNVTDPLIVLNNGSTVANIDIGFVMNRNNGTLPNVALFWDESANTFVASFTTSTGATNANVVISEYANVTAKYFIGDGSQLSNIGGYGNAQVAAYLTTYTGNVKAGNVIANTLYGNIGGGSVLSNVYITGSLIPTANVTYDLGTPTLRFRDGYFSGNTIYIGSERMSVDSNGRWSFTSGGVSVNLGHQDDFNPPSVNASGNVRAAHFNFPNGVSIVTTLSSAIENANTGLKGYVDGQVSTLTANAAVQAGNISTIFANLGSVSGSLATLTANAGAQAGSIATLTSNAAAQAGDIATIYANLGSVSGSIATLTANAATQAGDIATLYTNAGIQSGAIVSANVAMKGYVDSAIATVSGNANVQFESLASLTANAAAQAGEIANLWANAGVQTGNIATIFANLGSVSGSLATLTANAGAQAGAIVTANTAMKGYVDGQITGLVNGAPAALDTLNELAAALGNDANLSVTITNQIASVNSNITTANSAMKGYVDGQISTVNSNWQANAGVQAGNIATLFSNAATQAGQIASAEANIITANSAMKGYVDGQISTVNSNWQANAGVQAGDIATLFSNAAVQAGNIATIFANLGSVSGTLATLTANAGVQAGDIATLFANAGAQAGSITTLTSNAAVQAGQIASAEANITTANSAMKGYVDGQISSVNSAWQANAAVQAGNIATIFANLGSVSGSLATLTANAGSQSGDIATLFANAGAQAGSIATLTSNAAAQAGEIANLWANAGVQAGAIVTANTAMKGYVDGQITTLVNGAPATLDTLNELAAALGNDANLSVTLTNRITSAEANITIANSAMKGYVDGQISTVNSNWQANAAVQAGNVATLFSNAAAQAGDIATIYANLGSVSGSLATLTANAGAQAGSIATLTANAAAQAGDIATLFANAGVQSGQIITANTAMKGYVDGQISTVNSNWQANAGTQAGEIATLFANAGAQAGSIATLTSNAAVQAGDIATLFANAGAQAGIIASLTNYSNANVTSYLPTHSGNISATNANITANTASTSTTTGALVVAGGIGVGGNIRAGGNIVINGGATSTSNTTGALIVFGGVGVAGNIVASGIIDITNTTQSTSTSTGALIVDGGAGIAGNVWAGNLIATNFTYANGVSILTPVMTAWQANAGAQAGDIATLFANAGAQAGSIATLTSNAAVQAGDIATLFANAGAQSGAIVTANTAMKGYVDGQISTVNSSISTANTAMKGYVDGQITSIVNGAPSTLDTLNELAAALGNDANLSVTITNQIANVNSNITTANTAMKGYVDSQVLNANTGLKGYIDGYIGSASANANSQQSSIGALNNSVSALSGDIVTLYANAGAQAGSIATLTSNAAVQAGDIATLFSNAAVQAGNIATIFANLGSVSGSLATLTSNAAVQAGDIATLFANAGAQAGSIATLTSNAAVQAGNIATIFANLGAVSGSLAILTANAAAQAGDIATLTANAGAQAGSIATLNTTKANLSGAVFTGGIYATEIWATQSSGDEGGQLNLAPAATNTTISGNVVIDVWQNRLRIFESSGTNRGGFFDITALSAGVGTNLTAGGGGSTYSNTQVAAYLTTNQYATQTDISTANTAMKGYVDAINSTLTANAGAQAGSIATLTSNAAAQAGDLATIFANLGSVSGSLATLTSNAAVQAGNIATLFSNAAVQAGDIATLFANAGAQSGLITTLQGNITTLTSNAAVQAGDIATLFANAGAQAGSIATLTSNAAVQAGDIATLFANAGAQAGSIATLTSNAAVQAGQIASTESNIGIANTAMKGYVDGQISTVNSNWQANAAVQAGNIATIFANLGAVSGSLATLTANAGAQAGSIATLTANAGAQAGSITDLYTIKANILNPTFTNNVTVQGNLIISGNLFTTNVDNLQIDDSMIYMAENNATDFLDIGIVGSITKDSLYQHVGLVRDATDSYWKFFANVQPVPTSVIDFGSATYGSVLAGNLVAIGNVVVGANLRLTGALLNSAGDAGTNGQYLTTTGSGTAWTTIDFSTLSDGGTSSVEVTGEYVNVIIGGSELASFTTNTVSINGNVTANYFVGDGSQLTGIAGGEYGNAEVGSYLPTYSGNIGAGNVNATNLYGTIRTAAQTNITSVGTLTSLTVSGIASFAAGSAAAPSVTRTGDTNTGMFFPAADTIAFAEGGVESMRIDSSGSVGIGRTSIIGKLDVQAYGAGQANGLIVRDSSVNLTFAGLTATSSNSVDITASSFNDYAVDMKFWTDGGSGAGIQERMRITSTGNVGIGNTNPQHTLSVNGSTNVIGNSSIFADTVNISTANKVLRVVNSSQELFFSANLGAGSYNNLVAARDAGIIFSTGTQGQGNLTIGPWTSGGSSGIRIVGNTGQVTIPGFLNINSNNNATAIVNGGTNGVGNIGASGAGFNTVFARATSAQYADLAEIYTSDHDYVPGTVVIFGGEREVTVSTLSHDPRVAGVVSTNPAYIMNNSCDGVEVALQGRVPTKVQGPVAKGDRLVTSAVQGAAERLDMTKYQPGCIIGKALEDIVDDSIQTIEVVVGRV